MSKSRKFVRIYLIGFPLFTRFENREIIARQCIKIQLYSLSEQNEIWSARTRIFYYDVNLIMNHVTMNSILLKETKIYYKNLSPDELDDGGIWYPGLSVTTHPRVFPTILFQNINSSKSKMTIRPVESKAETRHKLVRTGYLSFTSLASHPDKDSTSEEIYIMQKIKTFSIRILYSLYFIERNPFPSDTYGLNGLQHQYLNDYVNDTRSIGNIKSKYKRSILLPVAAKKYKKYDDYNVRILDTQNECSFSDTS